MGINGIGNYYLESLDSVRTQNGIDKEDFEAQVNIIRLEFLYSILFGNKIVVPEPFIFDSRGFLYVSYEILGNAQISDGHWGSNYPIAMSNRGSINGKKYNNLSELMKAYASKQEYIFSLVPRKKQNEIKEIIHKENDLFNSNKFCDFLLLNNEDSLDVFNYLIRLSEYFSHNKSAFEWDNKEVSIRIQDFIDKLMTYTECDFESNDQITWDFVLNLQSVINWCDQQTPKIIISNRSLPRKIKYPIEETFYRYIDGFIEFIDTCYHFVVSGSVEAKIGLFTPASTTQDELKIQGNLLGIYIYDHLKRNDSNNRNDSSSDLELYISVIDETPKFNDIWGNVGEVIKNKNFYLSLNKLKKSLINTEGNLDDRCEYAKEALQCHIDYLSENLKCCSFKKKDNFFGNLSINLGAKYMRENLKKNMGPWGTFFVGTIEYVVVPIAKETKGRIAQNCIRRVFGNNVNVTYTQWTNE